MKTTIIRPESKFIQLNLKELYQYRELLIMFVKRDVVTFYKQTILGPIWFFINPIFTTVIYMIVFGNIAKLSTDGLPDALFYLSGIICWNYFADTLNRNSTTFTTNAHIFGKVYFPRLIVPLSIVISNLLKMCIQFLLFLAVYIYFIIKGVELKPNVYLLLVPYLIVLLACLGLGFGIIFSSLTTKYRDLTFLLSFGISLWQYLTPVIYPLSSISSSYKWIIRLNPLTPILETFKYSFMGVGEFTWLGMAYSSFFTLIVLLFGMLIFNRTQRTFMDTI